jgi:hypothetical protein
MTDAEFENGPEFQKNVETIRRGVDRRIDQLKQQLSRRRRDRSAGLGPSVGGVAQIRSLVDADIPSIVTRRAFFTETK